MSDASLFSLFHGLANKNQFLDWLIIFFAEYFIFILAIVAVILILGEKDWRRRAYFIALVVISTILSRGIFTELIQFYYHHPRPFVTLGFTPLIDHAPTSSFPSGHLAFFSVALTMYLFNRRVGIWFMLGTLLIGLARVSAGIHWPADVLGGIAVGSIAFLSTYYLLKIKGLTSNVQTTGSPSPQPQ